MFFGVCLVFKPSFKNPPLSIFIAALDGEHETHKVPTSLLGKNVLGKHGFGEGENEARR